MTTHPPSTSTTETSAPAPQQQGFVPLVSVVDFHHARGPEVERWFGVDEGHDPAVEYDWPLLPFMALSDGAHALTEDFSYFTLLRPATDTAPATSLFGISCTRQMDAAQLKVRPAEVTRSTVQKAVVVVADSPQYFGILRERLSMVTKAWFEQREFTNVDILRAFQDRLADEKAQGLMHEDEDRDQYLGLSLRELVREFRWQTLVLLKCCLLQPKMLFFGTRCERLCLAQFSLISLIPGLLRNLQDSAGPDLDNYEKTLSKPTSLRTSDRNSLLSYMGLPLQIFGKGSLFGPYTPLQQLDVLADFGTKSYIVGSTNSLLLQQRDRYSDILINLDEGTINITSTSLRAALQLSTPDRRWIDFVTQNVNDTWDDANPGRPKTMGYVGSEEFIRVQFEEYLLSLISSVKYHAHLAKHAHNPRMLLAEVDGDPSHDFGPDFVDAWSRAENYRIWNAHTDSHLFDIVEPRHPCAGGLTIDDIQRRITQQVSDLHWDERFAQGKEALGRNLAAGREKASTLFNKLYADMESARDAQRRRAEEARAQQQTLAERPGGAGGGQQQQAQQQGGGADKDDGGGGGGGGNNGAAAPAVDLAKAQHTMQAVGSKAGAYVSSWAVWAGEKRRAAAAGWARNSVSSTSGDGNHSTTGGSGGGGWSASWSKAGSKKRASQLSTRGGYDAVSEKGGGSGSGSVHHHHHHRRLSSSASSDRSGPADSRPLNRDDAGSVSGESMLDGAGPESALSSPRMVSPRKAVRPLLSAETPVIHGVFSSAGVAGGVVAGLKAEAEAEAEANGSGVVGDTSKGRREEDEDEERADDSSPPTPLPTAAARAEAAEAQKAWDR
ncbi:hypothetical protein BT67DRAFT_464947 [Trichocladium antarcticum]|uniref:UDENN domain-containing protein n=1 Tax=Trichocladium antarcticum TaxID=1450529 RepID=A0AAN6Z995_9PEZI|nr:hypothetical protein BT67DRAFT_464947 [Trichocladium antarcticum]